jgi:hypothetical protein
VNHDGKQEYGPKDPQELLVSEQGAAEFRRYKTRMTPDAAIRTFIPTVVR